MPLHTPIHVFSLFPVPHLPFHYPSSPVFIICVLNCIPAGAPDPVVLGAAQALELSGSSRLGELAVS